MQPKKLRTSEFDRFFPLLESYFYLGKMLQPETKVLSFPLAPRENQSEQKKQYVEAGGSEDKKKVDLREDEFVASRQENLQDGH